MIIPGKIKCLPHSPHSPAWIGRGGPIPIFPRHIRCISVQWPPTLKIFKTGNFTGLGKGGDFGPVITPVQKKSPRSKFLIGGINGRTSHQGRKSITTGFIGNQGSIRFVKTPPPDKVSGTGHFFVVSNHNRILLRIISQPIHCCSCTYGQKKSSRITLRN